MFLTLNVYGSSIKKRWSVDDTLTFYYLMLWLYVVSDLLFIASLMMGSLTLIPRSSWLTSTRVFTAQSFSFQFVYCVHLSCIQQALNTVSIMSVLLAICIESTVLFFTIKCYIIKCYIILWVHIMHLLFEVLNLPNRKIHNHKHLDFGQTSQCICSFIIA